MNQTTQAIANASAHNIPLPDEIFHTVCTSPPYYSLRRYAGAQDIDWPKMKYSPMPGLPPLTIEAMSCPLGLEPTPEAFIGHLVLCFREVWRVMREDAVAWVVLGDDFDAGQLQMTPHKFALAAQADGWTVRNDVVWAKKSPMPESVSGWAWSRHRIKTQKGDRAHNQFQHGAGTKQGPGVSSRAQRESYFETGTGSPSWQPCPGCPKCEPNGGYVLRRGSWRHTRAHEYVLMMSKRMGYFSNQERVKEPSTGQTGQAADFCRTTKDHLLPNQAAIQHRPDREPTSDNGTRNPRSVLTPRPSNFKGAHYAVYPPDLIGPLLRATAPTRCCPECGAPWAPVVEKAITDFSPSPRSSGNNDRNDAEDGRTTTTTTGHRQTCACPAHDPIPGHVLDPFVGSGTTLSVCAELGVNAVGLDISPQYLDEHAKVRIGQTPSDALEQLPMFAEVSA